MRLGCVPSERRLVGEVRGDRRAAVEKHGVTGLTEEIIAHLVECRVKRVMLLLDADGAGRAAALDMAPRLAAINIGASR